MELNRTQSRNAAQPTVEAGSCEELFELSFELLSQVGGGQFHMNIEPSPTADSYHRN